MPFTEKLIRLTIRLASNTQTNQPNQFAGTGSNQTVLERHRAQVRIVNQGAAVGSTATVKVWGLAPNLMTELSTLGLVYNVLPRNFVTVQAGDAAGMSTAFDGTIVQAYGDYRSQPDVPMILECNAGAFEDAAGSSMTSYPEPVAVAKVIEDLATKMGYGFENNGVTAMLQSAGGGGVALQGSALQQARSAADQAHVHLGVVFSGGGLTLSIWPWEGARTTPPVPLISPGNGLISYPIFTPGGIQFETEYNPAISFGGKVKVNSSLLNQVLGAQKGQVPGLKVPPNSEWAINQIDLALDSLLPKGLWQQTVYCWNPEYGRPTTVGQG